jgi:hypothetical protein
MNNSKIKIFLIVLIILFPLITFAGGSSFSRYGFGDILYNGDSRTYAMSGTGIALIDDGFINGLNPAGMARISYTRFSRIVFCFPDFNRERNCNVCRIHSIQQS